MLRMLRSYVESIQRQGDEEEQSLTARPTTPALSSTERQGSQSVIPVSGKGKGHKGLAESMGDGDQSAAKPGTAGITPLAYRRTNTLTQSGKH